MDEAIETWVLLNVSKNCALHKEKPLGVEDVVYGEGLENLRIAYA